MIPEGWKIELLGEFMIVKDGVHQTPTYTESGIPFLRVTDIQNEKINFSNTKYISKEEHEQITARLKPKKGDILYSKNGTIGITRIIDWDWEFSFFVSLALLRLKNNGYSVQYIAQYLQSSLAKREIYQGSKQGSVINLHLEEIQKFRVPLPPLPEQCKIAEILGAWDESIALLEKLITAKHKLKQGLMQQLLTGKKRFKEFEGSEWELQTLSNFGINGHPTVKAGPFGSSLKKEFYTYTGYKIYGQEQVIADSPFIGSYYIDESRFQKLKSCEVLPDDILITLVQLGVSRQTIFVVE
jgi:restriction endonuclease S subunit